MTGVRWAPIGFTPRRGHRVPWVHERREVDQGSLDADRGARGSLVHSGGDSEPLGHGPLDHGRLGDGRLGGPQEELGGGRLGHGRLGGAQEELGHGSLGHVDAQAGLSHGSLGHASAPEGLTHLGAHEDHVHPVGHSHRSPVGSRPHAARDRADGRGGDAHHHSTFGAGNPHEQRAGPCTRRRPVEHP